MAAKPTVSVNIRGKEFRVVGDEDVESLQRVAGYLDETMESVAKRTGIVDSLDISLLTGLNLARELVRIREGRASRASGATADQLRELTDRVEAAISETRADPA